MGLRAYKFNHRLIEGQQITTKIVVLDLPLLISILRQRQTLAKNLIHSKRRLLNTKQWPV